METVALSGEIRKETGKRASKAVRNAGLVPCVLYGGENDVHFSLKPYDMRDIVYTPDFKIAEINLDGKVEKAIIKEIQFHPVTDEIIHADFLRMIDGKPLIIEVPVKFYGDSPGVKEGGSLMPNMRRVKIKVAPENIVDKLRVDISTLELGHSVRVRDIELVEGVQVMNPLATPVASVEVPRALRSEDEEEEGFGEGEAGTETEETTATDE